MTSKKTEVIQAQPNSMIAPDPVLQLIERAATNPEVDIDKMERLLVMKERHDKQQAEMLFNKSMNEAQSEMKQVAFDSTNPLTKSFYASYSALDKKLRPIYTKYGFSLSFDTADCPTENWVRIVCLVSHAGGITRTPHIDLPADGKGAKGGDVMTKTHATGSAMSYGMRYLLKLVFNVAIGEDDDDGNDPDEYISEEQALELHARATENEVYDNFMSWLNTKKIEAIDHIQARDYENISKKLDVSIKARKANAED